MEIVSSPLRFASDIFNRVKSAPTRWGGRLQGLVPSLKNVKPKGIGLGGPVALLDTGVRIASGEDPLLAAGRSLSGWGGGVLGAGLMAPVPIPGARIGGGLVGYGAGTSLFDNTVERATDDRGISGLLRGKGWNNPFAPSPEAYIDPLSDEFGKRYPAQAITTSQPAVTDSQLNETAKALEKYGFNENFALQPNSDGNYNVVRSEAGQKADALVAENDALLAERDAWLARTANSPAARAGHSDEQRWNLQQKTRDFRNAQKTGTMDEFAQKYPNSNTAKERAIRNRIPSVMDMEF